MAYATVADIQTLLPFKFTSASSPTESQVADMIEAHSADLTLLLKSRGVPEPAPGTPAYDYCRLIVMYEVGADILARRAIEEGRDGSQQATLWERKAAELKQRLIENPQAFS